MGIIEVVSGSVIVTVRVQASISAKANNLYKTDEYNFGIPSWEKLTEALADGRSVNLGGFGACSITDPDLPDEPIDDSLTGKVKIKVSDKMDMAPVYGAVGAVVLAAFGGFIMY